MTIPGTVVSVGSAAFQGCTGLIKVENGISYVDKWAIGCDKTTTTAILRNDTIGIADYAFNGCAATTSVILNEGVRYIGSYAFRNCTALLSVSVPSSLTYSDQFAFEGCEALERVNITDISAWCSITFEDIMANPLYFSSGFYINDVAVTEIVIPDGTTIIENFAFAGGNMLTSISVPDSITYIGKSAFHSCSGITEIHIPTGISAIED
jgi:hypothetical protein